MAGTDEEEGTEQEETATKEATKNDGHPSDWSTVELKEYLSQAGIFITGERLHLVQRAEQVLADEMSEEEGATSQTRTALTAANKQIAKLKLQLLAQAPPSTTDTITPAMKAFTEAMTAVGVKLAALASTPMKGGTPAKSRRAARP